MTIRWPERYSPERSEVRAHNEIDIPVRPEIVWAWLVRAELWPTWYSNSSQVRIDGGGPDLKQGSRFRWKTFGVRLDSKVEEFVPFERISWSARATGIDVYHAWLITRTSEGCHVLTEENQNGWLARFSNALRPRNMTEKHQTWLEGLRAKSVAGEPPSPAVGTDPP